ncbi:neuronal acetylcholine receptor subunit beta-2-like isoform X2 [Pomacea canaliculata]|uniref:neuronal acetylcholine receptor subunit beta-2-like isoform X2 n=1 Tax=Pomacea canaliculata TaxID=400727 RepID=UPI000D725E40|nr:neuronal acetylcholine receptor subunit beta-2-like isoform X2 [Pomacea canaliculata]
MAVSVYPPGYSATADDVARLHSDLFSTYKRVIPPVFNQTHAVKVRLSLFLLMIHDLDMKNQVLTTSGWVNMQWDDEFLTWDPSKYGGVEEITVAQKSVWLPDLLVENTAQNFAELGSDSMLVSIAHTGHMSWEPGILTKTICEVNIGKYPFDFQSCEIKFLTWMHTNKTLDVQPGSDSVGLDACIPNGEWDITQAVAEPYFYPSTYRPGTAHTGVTFRIRLHRKRTFYVLNTIIPVVMLSLLNVLVFLLPASSGEKMALAVTVLLSFTVYLSIISEVMPKTSESISILAVYLTLLLSLSTLSVLSSGVVMNMIHQEADRPVPTYLKCLLCCRRRQIRDRLRLQLRRRHIDNDQSFHNGDLILLRKRAPPDGNVSDGTLFSEGGNSHRSGCSQPSNEAGVAVPGSGRLGATGSEKEQHMRAELTPLFDDVLPRDDFVFDDWAYVTWLDVGSAIDNLLFWVFLFITVASTVTVLLLFSY